RTETVSHRYPTQSNCSGRRRGASVSTNLIAIIVAGSFLASVSHAQYTVLHHLDASPEFATPLGTGSTLYATAYRWGEEAVFKMNSDGGCFTRLHTFAGAPNDGSQPLGQLVLSGQSLYGMTTFGGSATDDGTIYTVNLDGSGYGILHVFGRSNNGIAPFGSLTLVDSSLYGMTTAGATPTG